uniref:Uncharacterized protein n=1 Tax=Podarcis muralis TaxID=64176 RepID=A0A670JRQ6_PODMU
MNVKGPWKSRLHQVTQIVPDANGANLSSLGGVRRAALRHRLSFEHLQYQLELNHLGKSFFTERL